MGLRLQMTWKQQHVHNQKSQNQQEEIITIRRRRRKSVLPPIGLRNMGNSCYLNSVLQCLTYTPPLAHFSLLHLHSSLCDSAAEQDRKQDCPFCILEKRIAKSLSVDLPIDTPAKLYNCLRIYADHFRQGRQEDAHEFLRYVIDTCHDTCLRLKKLQQQQKWKKGENGVRNEDFGGCETVIKEIFGGSLQSQVKCFSCGLESNKVDEIMDISLDILKSRSIEESMKKFFQAEVLDGNNKYKCDKCKQLVKARKQMFILQAPNVFVIQLKRFGGIFGGKIDRAISFEEVLVLSSYMSKSSQDPYPEYNLFGTIVHSGFSPDSGHYYAYIKDAMGRWYCCNDACVKLSSSKEVLSEKVYILFFSRSKQRPVPTNSALLSNGVKSEKCNGKSPLKTQKVVNSVPANAALTSNGSKSQECNGSDAFKAQMKENFVNGAYPKEAADTAAKVNKVPFGPQPYLNSNGNSSNKLSSSTAKISIVLHTNLSNGKNAHLKPSSSLENLDKDISSFNGNGVAKCEIVQADQGMSSHPYSLANGNGKAKCSSSPRLAEGGMTNCNGLDGTTIERGDSKHELQNGGVNHSVIPDFKRKLLVNDSCILLAEDVESRKKVEEFKESIGKEASSALRSCGWTEEALTYMRARKKLCLQGTDAMAVESNELKKLLISEAKQKLVSRIPSALKEKLVQNIRTFGHEKE